jgi:DNA adenine methylase
VSSSPFLRWAGAKRAHLDRLQDFVPSRYGTYFEPFLGSGALFFHLEPDRAVLGDQIPRLIGTYRAVRDGPSAVHRHISQWPVDSDSYYQVRESQYRSRYERAAQFIYLNKTCWNGLYRVNSTGKFNVPYGRPKSSNIASAQLLLDCAAGLRRDITIEVSDFEELANSAKRGDFVFFDPPYVTGHNNNGFVDYNEHLFSWQDQVRLALLVERLARRGVRVMLTNTDHHAVRDLYDGFRIAPIVRQSTIASNPKHRRTVREIIVVPD